MHDLDLLVDQDVGQLEGRVRGRVLDDLVCELVARLVEGVPLEARLDLHPHGGKVGERAQRAREVVVLDGQDLLAELLQVDLEPGGRSGEGRFGIVVGEGDVEAGRLARLQPDEVGLEPRDQPLLAEDQGHAFRRSAVERDAVARALVADHRIVAVARATILDWSEGRVLVAQLLDRPCRPSRRRSARSRA